MAQGHTCMSRALMQSQSAPKGNAIMQLYTDRNSLRPEGQAMSIQRRRHTACLIESLSLLANVHWGLGSGVCSGLLWGCAILDKKKDE